MTTKTTVHLGGLPWRVRLQLLARQVDLYQAGALLLIVLLIGGALARQALAHVSIGWRTAPIIIVATARPDAGLFRASGHDMPTPPLPTVWPTEAPEPIGVAAALALPTQSPAGAAPETAPARDYAAEAQQAINASVPANAELHQDPGGSYLQAPGSLVKYDIDASGNVTNVRLPGADVAPAAGSELPSEQKVYLNPADPADAAAIAAAAGAQQLVPTVAHPCASRRGCRR